ncbi:MAG: MarR family transcriptional regulator [Pseudomonadota bacterium]
MKPLSDPRRFLRDEELDVGITLILGAERRLAGIMSQMADEVGLSPTDLRLLMTIHGEPGLTVRGLRRRMVATVPTLARQLGDLDKRGLIDRRQSAEDRRERAVHLSEEGEARLAPILSALRSALRDAYRAAGVEAVGGTRDVLGVIAKV